MGGVDDEEAPQPALWELLLAVLTRGLCASCHFSPASNGGADGEPWRCPRCGFLSCDDPDYWGPVSRLSDPVGADEPRYAGDDIEDDEDEDSVEVLEADFPIYGGFDRIFR